MKQSAHHSFDVSHMTKTEFWDRIRTTEASMNHGGYLTLEEYQKLSPKTERSLCGATES